MERCPWCEGFDLYREYHDSEWGVPLHDDRALFELLILEGAQAGLSWATILKKSGKLTVMARQDTPDNESHDRFPHPRPLSHKRARGGS
jgi:hypothetical protein